MTITDQQRPATYIAPASELLTSDWERPALPELAGIAPVPSCDAARERALAAMRHESVRAEAKRRLLSASGTGALGRTVGPRW